MKNNQIINKIQKFINKQNISIRYAQEIEQELDSLNSNNDLIIETILMLTSYRPSGGEFLYNENQLIKQLNKVLVFLKEDVE